MTVVCPCQCDNTYIHTIEVIHNICVNNYFKANSSFVFKILGFTKKGADYVMCYNMLSPPPLLHPNISQNLIKGHVHVNICIAILFLVSRIYVFVVIIKHDKGCVEFLPVMFVLAGNEYICT